MSIMQFFSFDHLPEPMKSVSKKFSDVATEMNEYLPENPEKTVMLRKLLEAKDCAVRAVLFKETVQNEAVVEEVKAEEQEAA